MSALQWSASRNPLARPATSPQAGASHDERVSASPSAGATNAWSRFTRQADKFPEDAQVGNVHGGPNAKSGYDYGQTNVVMSGADDWFNYPNLTGAKKPVSAATWGRPHHLNFMHW